MAHLRVDFRSEVMDMNTSMTVVLPEQKRLDNTKVVYLLHGLADNCSGWSRYTSVERYAREKDVALVIPEVQRSFYADMIYGLDYFKFINNELHTICQNFFGFSEKRENRYVMGLSMGGYGALKCALTSPEKYQGCAAFSAVADIETTVFNSNDGRKNEYKAIFGSTIPDESNLFKLLDKVDDLPSIYLSCGDEDPRIIHSEKMAKALKEKGCQVKYEHWGGEHNWIFWDQGAKRAFDYFFN